MFWIMLSDFQFEGPLRADLKAFNNFSKFKCMMMM